jgi:hypothetical protein
MTFDPDAKARITGRHSIHAAEIPMPPHEHRWRVVKCSVGRDVCECSVCGRQQEFICLVIAEAHGQSSPTPEVAQNDGTLSEALERLRAIPTELGDDAIAELRMIRHGPEVARGETDVSGIVERLRAACVGHPAVIAWPHRLLHEAADALLTSQARAESAEAEVARLRAAVEAARNFVTNQRPIRGFPDWDALNDSLAALAPAPPETEKE